MTNLDRLIAGLTILRSNTKHFYFVEDRCAYIMVHLNTELSRGEERAIIELGWKMTSNLDFNFKNEGEIEQC